MKKLLVLVALAGIGYVVYTKFFANKAEEDLWEEANAPVDLTFPEPSPAEGDAEQI